MNWKLILDMDFSSTTDENRIKSFNIIKTNDNCTDEIIENDVSSYRIFKTKKEAYYNIADILKHYTHIELRNFSKLSENAVDDLMMYKEKILKNYPEMMI